MPNLEQPGATINYEIWGEEGAWITLINGHNRSLSDFRFCGRYLNQRGWRVLALDNRGAGNTLTGRPFTFAEMVSDVIAIWDAEGIIRTRLLGVSMGGFIAQSVAALAGSRVAKLVLVSTASNPSEIRRDDAPWLSDPDAVLSKLLPYFAEPFAARNALLLKSMAKQIAKGVAEGDFAKFSEWQRQAIADLELTELAGTIRVPTLIVHGQDDQIIPVQAAYELASSIRGSHLEVFADTGHLLLAERPRELYHLIGEFFRA